MNYKKIHDQIINRAIYENRKKHQGIYYEKHHIIPKCLCGTNDKENLVNLTAREHFLIHWLLCRIYPNNYKLAHAFCLMTKFNNNGSGRQYKVTSRVYKEAKELQVIANGQINYSHTEEAKLQIGIASKNQSTESRKRAGEKRKGVLKGPIHSQETKERWSLIRKGRKRSQTSIDKQRLKRIGSSKGKILAYKYPSMEFVGEYVNTIVAAKELSVRSNYISKVITGNRLHSNNYTFKRI